MDKTNKRLITIIIILLLLLIGALLYIFIFKPHNNTSPILPEDESAVEWQGEQPPNRLPTGQEGIAIPGFKSLVFIANEKSQKVNFFNPESNDCLFLMTLYVNDSALWKSGYCRAGKGYYNIELNRELTAGEYPAYLKIQCFKNTGAELNGARVDFNLIVKER